MPVSRWASAALLAFGLGLVWSADASAGPREPAAAPVSAKWGNITCTTDRLGNLRVSSYKCIVDGKVASSTSPCRSLARPTTAQCTNSGGATYAWSSGSWGACSKTCGGGTQTRTVSCKTGGTAVADSFCSTTKPASSQSCNTQTCTATDTIPPTVPSGLSADGSTCQQVTLSWKASTDTGGSGLSHYDVYRNSSYVARVQAPLVGMIDSGVSGSSLSYQVEAFDKAGNRSGLSASKAPAPCISTGVGVVGSVPGFGFPDVLALDSGSGIAAGLGMYGLTIADVSNPSRPTVSSTMDIGNQGDGVAVAGNYVFVTEQAGSSGSNLVTLDATDPMHASVIARTALGAVGGGLAIQGALAYVATSAGLATVDLTNPRAPRLLGITPTSFPLFSVKIGDGIAVAKTPDSFAIFDTSNPRSPILGWSGRGIYGTSFDVGGKIAYIVANLIQVVLNCSDPRILDVDATFNLTTSVMALAGSRAVFSSTNGVNVYDVSDSTRLQLITQVAMPPPRRLAADGDIAIASDLSGILSVISIR